MAWLKREPKQEHESTYELPVQRIFYDEEGYELEPDLWGGGYHRKGDEEHEGHPADQFYCGLCRGYIPISSGLHPHERSER